MSQYPPHMINAKQTPEERRAKYKWLLAAGFSSELARDARDWRMSKVNLLILHNGNSKKPHKQNIFQAVRKWYWPVMYPLGIVIVMFKQWFKTRYKK